MINWLREQGLGSEIVNQDAEIAEALARLDPAAADPNYWFRFRGWVMTSAAGELARRRIMAQLTVGDVLQSWARTLVPTAVLAAAVAGMLLVRAAPAQDGQPIRLEELLVTEIRAETHPVLLVPDEFEGVILFASESF